VRRERQPAHHEPPEHLLCLLDVRAEEPANRPSSRHGGFRSLVPLMYDSDERLLALRRIRYDALLLSIRNARLVRTTTTWPNR
jgi:hypothetical protein